MEDKHFAVLIDAENISDKYIKYIFNELSNDGIVTYKRIYGDWTRPGLSSWKNILLEYSITPIQQYSYTTGKNATDSAMIIDAMDILYTGKVEGFCIVSSDSDFTRLVSRLRESGMYVIGMGEKKTPSPFISACSKFKYLEVLSRSNPETANDEQDITVGVTSISDVTSTLLAITDDISDDDGWSSLSELGNIITKRIPDFDVRNYGYSKLTPFVSSLGVFDIKSVPKNNLNIIYVRRK